MTTTATPHADLRARWLPSPEQMKVANALLAAGYIAERCPRERCPRRERGVFTTHLLVNSAAVWEV